MKCVSPFYVVRDRNWVPCGKCNFCLQRNRSGWTHRIHQHLKAASSAAFITLTYAEPNAVYTVSSRELTLEKTHVQKFMKRLRKHESKIRRPAISYYLVGEYGGETGRPHYHALMFNLHQDTLGNITDIWGQGHVHVGKVEPASVAYVTGYVINKNNELEDAVRVFPFSHISQGIGKSYLTPQMKRYHKRGKRNYGQVSGHKYPLSRYYADKIFSKLDKKVMGLKMEIELDKKFTSELQRLEALHSDPWSYYQEKSRQAYDRVRTMKGSI